ncbi:FGGY-family carbohydrate kinase [Gephyromycinifex aptenodytis]|uniref:FGGY-family carbohydrate kinase n=1 Tax=Gephyromycinifex aptenodytis TaxID=2716227 RepID=UPI00144642A9|nr:FGGY family carbohydrate kinase [Gephyromycinifex aptenodytis]
MRTFLGIDVGTSSTKGVIADESGAILAQAVRRHDIARPHPGWAEMDATVWWEEFVSLTRELLEATGVVPDGVGVSGMGPCVLITDEHDRPLRPAILYGVDTRAVSQIRSLEEELGREEVLQRAGSLLSTQAVGPKLEWLHQVEPDSFDKARRLYMPASFLVRHLTGEYTLDHQSASQSVPLYDGLARDWYHPWAERIAPQLELPRLGWADEIAGQVRRSAATETGLAAGTPVVFGTIDAWTEAVSVDAHGVGDLMLMYGTTMFMVNTVADRVVHPALWSTIGALPETRNLAAGMATSGAVTNWMQGIFGGPGFDQLTEAAAASPPGANGLLCLPYFSGERTPIADPAARGVLIGLTTSHSQGDLYRAALEGTAMGVRHNIEAFRAAGSVIERVVAVGGGLTGGLWAQIVSDVAGVDQIIPTSTIGASYGAALLVARPLVGATASQWNPPAQVLTPRVQLRERYDELFGMYQRLYPATADIQHSLAAMQSGG